MTGVYYQRRNEAHVMPRAENDLQLHDQSLLTIPQPKFLVSFKHEAFMDE